MAILQRPNSSKLYFKFMHHGKQYFRSAQTTDRRLAVKRERQFRSDLERGLIGKLAVTESATEIPTFVQFASWPAGRFWLDYAGKYQAKPNTYQFYKDRIQALLRHPSLPRTSLDRIDKAMIDSIVAWRLGEGRKASTINRDLTVLQRILRKACDWKLIREMPMFPRGTERLQEAKRGFVVSPADERIYIDICGCHDQQDFVRILVDTGMEPGTAASLRWDDVHLEKSGEFEYGFVHDGCQKTKSRERDIPLTKRLQNALHERAIRQASWPSAWVFPAEKRSLKPTPLSTFQSRHKRLWTANKLTLPPFRLYDFRHTALTRLRDSGADRFELALYAGWRRNHAWPIPTFTLVIRRRRQRGYALAPMLTPSQRAHRISSIRQYASV